MEGHLAPGLAHWRTFRHRGAHEKGSLRFWLTALMTPSASMNLDIVHAVYRSIYEGMEAAGSPRKVPRLCRTWIRWWVLLVLLVLVLLGVLLLFLFRLLIDAVLLVADGDLSSSRTTFPDDLDDRAGAVGEASATVNRDEKLDLCASDVITRPVAFEGTSVFSVAEVPRSVENAVLVESVGVRVIDRVVPAGNFPISMCDRIGIAGSDSGSDVLSVIAGDGSGGGDARKCHGGDGKSSEGELHCDCWWSL